MAMVLKLFISKLHLFNDLVYDTFIDTINAKLDYILCVLDLATFKNGLKKGDPPKKKLKRTDLHITGSSCHETLF